MDQDNLVQGLSTLCYLQGWMPKVVDQAPDRLISFCETDNLIPLEKHPLLFKAQALFYFEHHLKRRSKANLAKNLTKYLTTKLVMSSKFNCQP
jgi:hypothetical protein